MAVQAQQQQLQKLLENASTTCLPFQTMGSVADNNGNRGGTGWPPCHEGLVLDAYLQQQQQPMGATSDPTLGVNQNAQVPVGVPLASLFLERQRREEDQFILQQAESFRLDLQRLRRKHAASMTKLLELKASALLKRREEEVAKVVRRTVELEEFIRRGEMEVQTWQKVAREHEVIAMDLSQRLERIQNNNNNNNCYNVNNNGIINCFRIVDESSCCSSSPLPVGEEEEEEEEEEEDGLGEVRRFCRWCHSRDSSVLFLPCRHLSTCKICSEFLTTCPVCSTTKQGSFEVFMS